MKQEFKINHEADTMTSAFGTTSTEMAEQITHAVRKFIEDKRSNRSVLGEIIHENVDYKIILFLATEHIEKMVKSSSKSAALMELLEILKED